MKLNRKKVTFLVAIICLSLILGLSSLLNSNNIAKSEPLSQSDIAEAPSGSLLVVPESPIGTLGVLAVLGAAFGLFVTIKRRK